MASSNGRGRVQVDFERIKDALLADAERLVPDWLPKGRREGPEWKCGNLRGDPGRSCSVNLRSGAWADFAEDERGNDLISLYAAIKGLEQIDAAIELGRQLGVGLVDDADTPRRTRTVAAPAPRPAPPSRSDWDPVIPVPESAPVPPVAHVKRGRAEMSWHYRDREGRLLGVVYRFRTSDGGKDVLPCVWAVNRVTGAAEWHWMQWAQPRPLYGLDRLRDDLPILVVEGEKCADAAQQLLAGTCCVMSWPGGGKAVDKADWSPLAGRSVVIWPDCDAQVYKGNHPMAGEIRPEAEQPGIQAAEAVAAQLVALGARVRIVRIPPPGAKPDGWDVADAIAEGWGADQVKAFLREQRLPACEEPPTTVAPAEEVDWWGQLITSGRGVPKDCRENVIVILRDHPSWAGVLAWDEFAKRVVVRRPAPTGHVPGHVWGDQDDIALGLWLTSQLELQIRSTDTIAQAVGYTARKHAFHPVREYLDALVWDRKPRVERWTVDFLNAADTHYHRRVGEFFLINMVRRIFEPGCVMRSVMVLEGGQNVGKSRALHALAQPWYSDTLFRVGDKDAYLLLQGTWLYEISELESFTRSEATAVKAFVSSTEDSFRAPYARQPEKHPRQVAFAGTTNATEYLKDFSGNTRFWPVSIGTSIDLAGLAAARDQLFAEAVQMVRAGARSFPTAEEVAEHFTPQQDQRQVEHPWRDVIDDWVHKMAAERVTVRQLLEEALGVDLSRASPNGMEAQRVGQILQAMGWVKRRASGEGRAWYWSKPLPAREPGSGSAHEDTSDVPF